MSVFAIYFSLIHICTLSLFILETASDAILLFYARSNSTSVTNSKSLVKTRPIKLNTNYIIGNSVYFMSMWRPASKLLLWLLC